MPAADYDARPDTVQAYKRAHHIGRFDPAAPQILEARATQNNALIVERDIAVGARCRLLPAESDGRRGEVVFVGEVDELPGVPGAKWIGVRLDEPVGRNDGSVPIKGDGGGSKRYFQAERNSGAFVRPEKIECGDFAVVDEFAEDSDMEEL